jgi:hypothetical protein
MSDICQINPQVDAVREFIEIANDFSNPLDIVREAISNAYDAKANKIWIAFDVIDEYGDRQLRITLKDNGHGMNKEDLQAFFNLGSSSRRSDKDAIGEKGHGTKVYFNSLKVEVTSKKDKKQCHAVMDKPFKKLKMGELPTVSVTITDADSEDTETTIIIYGYRNNSARTFTHAVLKDHIMWFTKHGAIENIFDSSKNKDVTLYLKGLDVDHYEEIAFGHYFPEQSKDITKLLEVHTTKAADFYCKRIKKDGHLENFPDIKYQAIFSIEGKQIKFHYNQMIRRQGWAPEGGYTIQDRYGIWICKDYIPIERKNDWIVSKGYEFTKFHAFFNCQGLSLTANRGSIDNTRLDVLADIEQKVKKIHDEITSDNDWQQMEWLEDESVAIRSIEKERNNFKFRLNQINGANVADYKGTMLVEPKRESGVLSLFLILSQIEKDIFPFQIIDYDTHEGIDVIAKGDKTTPIQSAKLYYVEFKRNLTKIFNHSFKNIHSVVCWDTDVKHDEEIEDIQHKTRKLKIIPPNAENNYTQYFLDLPGIGHRIEVFVLKDYLKEKLNIDFRPRTKDAVV